MAVETETREVAAEEQVVFQLKENLQGRIRNLALSPSYENTLIPLFEAISNSIHSIQERFSEEWTKKGKITVYVHHNQDGQPVSFSVEDNGIGLNKDNFLSFLTYDSGHKLMKGGKGVGRLTWLKVFDLVKVESVYHEEDQFQMRSFDFTLDNDNSVKNYEHRAPAIEEKHRTTVYLQRLKEGYSSCCPKKTESIAHKIIGHFLPFLIGDECPNIVIEDPENKYDLRTILGENTYNVSQDEYEVEDVGEFEIQHLLLNKSLVEKAEHTVYLSAHGRIVSNHVINNQTGLNTYFEYEGQSVAYVGIVSSDYLDVNVTQERNNFDIRKENYKAITKGAEESAKEYLKEPIERVIEVKGQTVEKVVSEFPRYKYLVKDKKEFARNLPLNKRTEEEIYGEMSVYDYRENRTTKRQLQAVMKAEEAPDTMADFEGIYNQLIVRISEQEKSSLAEYVAKRKAIIDLLESRLSFEDPEKKRRYKEDAVHKIICPLKVESGDIAYGDHNLWLIDDRLAYYDFWASDKNIKSYAESSESAERPDLALFQGSNLLHREGTDQPVVIVEFKRPAREEYTDEENPLPQIFGYIRELRENKISDKNGNLITRVGEDTPFFCYVVCDITPKLNRILSEYDINQKLPGERGYFGYNKTHKAYIEIIQYDQIVKDARLRHEAFFKELGVN